MTILFIVESERESQMAYKELMMSRIKFKPFIIRGKNVRDKLKRELQINVVPTLLFKRKKVESYRNIKILIDHVDLKLKNTLRPERRQRPPSPTQSDDEISGESIEETDDEQESSDEEDSMSDFIALPENEGIVNTKRDKKIEAEKKKGEMKTESVDDLMSALPENDHAKKKGTTAAKTTAAKTTAAKTAAAKTAAAKATAAKATAAKATAAKVAKATAGKTPAAKAKATAGKTPAAKATKKEPVEQDDNSNYDSDNNEDDEDEEMEI